MKKISKYRSVLMGLGIIYIYIFHNVSAPKPAPLWYLWRQGYTAVDQFILLSGFGMVYSLSKNPVNNVKSYFNFELNRFIRIYLSFLPVTALIALVDNWTKAMIIGRITYVEQFSSNMYIHLWYVGSILLFYIFVPFYYALFSRFKNKKMFTIASMAIAIIAGCVAHYHVRDDIVSSTITRIPIFMLGIYWGYLSLNETNTPTEKPWGSKVKDKLFIYALFVVGVALTYYGVLETNPKIPGVDQFLSSWFIFHYPRLLFNPPLVIILADIAALLDKIKIGQILNKMWMFLGTITLEIYCLHEWVFEKCSALQTSIDAIRWQLATVIIVFFMSVGIHQIANNINQKLKLRQKN